jgi:hypothetical protein
MSMIRQYGVDEVKGMTEEQFLRLYEDQALHKSLFRRFISGKFYISRQLYEFPPLNENDVPDAIQRIFMLVWDKRQNFKPDAERRDTPLFRGVPEHHRIGDNSNLVNWVYWKALDIRKRIDITLNRTNAVGADLSSSTRLVSYHRKPPDGYRSTTYADGFSEEQGLWAAGLSDKIEPSEHSLAAQHRRNKVKASGCPHKEQPHFAKGKCEPCYRRGSRLCASRKRNRKDISP